MLRDRGVQARDLPVGPAQRTLVQLSHHPNQDGKVVVLHREGTYKKYVKNVVQSTYPSLSRSFLTAGVRHACVELVEPVDRTDLGWVGGGALVPGEDLHVPRGQEGGGGPVEHRQETPAAKGGNN